MSTMPEIAPRFWTEKKLTNHIWPNNSVNWPLRLINPFSVPGIEVISSIVDKRLDKIENQGIYRRVGIELRVDRSLTEFLTHHHIIIRDNNLSNFSHKKERCKRKDSAKKIAER